MSENTPGIKLVKGTKPKAKVTEAPQAEVQEQPQAEVAAPVKTAKLKLKKPIEQAQEVEAQAEEQAVDQVESDDQDLIVKIAHRVENLTEARVKADIPKLLNNIEQEYFTLGGYAARVQANSWFMNDGYEKMADWCQGVLGIKYRKCMYWIEIYNGLVQSGVPWTKVGHLGWTKLREIAAIVTPENVDSLVEAAEARTVIQLAEYVKALKAATKAPSGAGGGEAQSEVKVTSMLLKLHPDQKATVNEAIAKAKADLGTDVQAVAIEHICLDYLAGDAKVVKKAPTLEAQMKDAGAEAVLDLFGKVFPDIELQATVPEENA